MSGDTDTVLISIQDKVATITFNRPEKYNAFTARMVRDLAQKLYALAEDPEVGVVVLTGTGKAFSAGGDVNEMADAVMNPHTLEETTDFLRRAQEFAWALHHIPKITIAAVNGFAMGAGLGVALSCDLRIAASRAKFGTAYAKVGLGGDFGVTWKLARLVGEAKAKELFVLADTIEAPEALRIGLVNRVVETEKFQEEVSAIAKRLAHGPLVSFRYMKENINLSSHCDFKTILDREAMTHMRCMQTEDFREGAMAFMEKREPKFQGK